MEQLWFYLVLGFEHVMDVNGLDHFYFLIALTLPFVYTDWKKLLWLVTLFTLGHSFSLVLAYFGWVSVSGSWVEFLIPITIILTCISLLSKKQTRNSKKISRFADPITLIFGLIHGLGFGRYFSQIVLEEDAYPALLSFAIGVEIAQLLIVSGVVLVNMLVFFFFKKSKYKWQWIIASMILSQALVMAIENSPF